MWDDRRANRFAKSLSKLQGKMWLYLWSRPGKLVTYESISKDVWNVAVIDSSLIESIQAAKNTIALALRVADAPYVIALVSHAGYVLGIVSEDDLELIEGVK